MDPDVLTEYKREFQLLHLSSARRGTLRTVLLSLSGEDLEGGFYREELPREVRESVFSHSDSLGTLIRELEHND